MPQGTPLLMLSYTLEATKSPLPLLEAVEMGESYEVESHHFHLLIRRLAEAPRQIVMQNYNFPSIYAN